MRFRPKGDQVLVKCEPLKETIENGVTILSHQKRVRHGEVLAVGPGRRHFKTDALLPVDIAPGARVAFFRENMETLHGKQVVRTVMELSEELGADLAIIPESAILGEVGKDTKVTA